MSIKEVIFFADVHIFLRTCVNDCSSTESFHVRVLKIGTRTIDRVKKKFVEEDYEAAMQNKPTSRVYKRTADGEVEAHLVALSCSTAPEGFTKWSLRLLADKMIELKYVEDISYETVRRVLKKTNYALGK